MLVLLHKQEVHSFQREVIIGLRNAGKCILALLVQLTCNFLHVGKGVILAQHKILISIRSAEDKLIQFKQFFLRKVRRHRQAFVLCGNRGVKLGNLLHKRIFILRGCRNELLAQINVNQCFGNAAIIHNYILGVFFYTRSYCGLVYAKPKIDNGIGGGVQNHSSFLVIRKTINPPFDILNGIGAALSHGVRRTHILYLFARIKHCQTIGYFGVNLNNIIAQFKFASQQAAITCAVGIIITRLNLLVNFILPSLNLSPEGRGHLLSKIVEPINCCGAQRIDACDRQIARTVNIQSGNYRVISFLNLNRLHEIIPRKHYVGGCNNLGCRIRIYFKILIIEHKNSLICF